MNPNRWQRIRELLEAALERPPNERASFLDQACDSDPELRKEVESLINYQDEAERFLENPPVNGIENPKDSSRPLMGRTLAHYDVLEEIGRGGMGKVHRAQDLHLRRDVAIKFLPSGVLADEQARKRFRKEALALSKLNHPNIATIHDFDTEQGVDFLVMEYVEGKILAEKLKTGPMAEKEISNLGAQIAEALEDAHEKGVVHRDLKPGNIAVTPKDRVKVLDFGLARLTRPVSDEATTEALTQEHAVAGTLPYMAPEELRGERADHRSDLYSLGVVLYEMATGRRPFEEKLSTALTDAILHKQPEPPSSRNRNVPPALESIILKALEKDPKHRYQSAREMRVDLEQMSAPGSPAFPKWKKRVRWQVWTAAASSVVAAMVGLVYLFAGGSGTPQIDSIAVLPLENLSGDPEQEFFAEGMTEALITDLAKIQSLKVISRSSTMRFKDTEEPIRDIATLLNVDAVVEGSVLRVGDRVRITAQLTHAETEQHLWADSYERALKDILMLQGEVAREIANEIQLKLTPQEEVRLATARQVDPDSHVAYLKGRYYFDKRTKEDMEKGLRFYQEAIEKDPTHAAAYAGLADTYIRLPQWGSIPKQEAILRARAAIERAMELDETLPNIHAALGRILLAEGDLQTAEKEYKRAIELNPSFASAHDAYSVFLFFRRGRLDEAIAEAKRARELDPLSTIINVNLGRYLVWARRFDEAVDHLRKAVELNPESGFAYYWLGDAHLGKSMYDEAVEAWEQATNLLPNYIQGGSYVPAFLAYAYGKSGRVDEARTILAEMFEQSETKNILASEMAIAHLAVGEKSRALDWLEKAVEVNEQNLDFYIEHDFHFDLLRDQPRFQDLQRRMNIPQ